MKIKIKRIAMEHFKGIAGRIIELYDSTDVRGLNGSGKSTIASSVYWVLCDCDYQLNNKPMVQPLNDAEVKPHVRLWLDIDGREITVDKTQKTVVKVDENSGKTTATTTNTYAINDVPKTLRDFTQYFAELGIDLDKLLVLSHPDAFTKDNSAKGRDKMRATLFEMVDEKSDLDIAKEMPEAAELTIELGKNYKIEEIKAMNQATIKKIESEDGKHNELIDARIQGLIEGKTDVDVKAIQSELDNLNKKKSQILEMLNDSEKPNDLDDKVRELAKERQGIIDRTNEESEQQAKAIGLKFCEIAAKKREVLKNNSIIKMNIADTELSISEMTKQLDSLREEYKEVSEEDVIVSTSCPYCGQPLPEADIDASRKKMTDKKTKKLNQLIASAETLKDKIATSQGNIGSDKEMLSKIENELKTIEEEENFLSTRAEEIKVDPYALPEVLALADQISELTARLSNSPGEEKERLNDEYNKVSEAIENCKATLKQSEQNGVIDSKVAELRQKKTDDEVTKAKAEKMLFQVTEFEKFKNNLLTAEINKHFDLVDWRLFEIQKNGEYKACCYPTYEGKAIDVDTNTALSVAMRLDIASSLQRFNNLYVPIFIDKAESLDTQTRNDIASHSDTQIIWLTVSDNELEVCFGGK